MAKKMTFALAFCNRGFMPGELIYGAREDMVKAVTDPVPGLLLLLKKTIGLSDKEYPLQEP